MPSDTPTITRTLASLEVEAAPEQYVWGTKAGKRVVFPDPGEMDAWEAEEFLKDLSGRGVSTSSREALTKWVGEAGVKALDAEKFTYRQFLALMNDVQNHYKSFFGDPGESPASES